MAISDFWLVCLDHLHLMYILICLDLGLPFYSLFSFSPSIFLSFGHVLAFHFNLPIVFLTISPGIDMFRSCSIDYSNILNLLLFRINILPLQVKFRNLSIIHVCLPFSFMLQLPFIFTYIKVFNRLCSVSLLGVKIV